MHRPVIIFLVIIYGKSTWGWVKMTSPLRGGCLGEGPVGGGDGYVPQRERRGAELQPEARRTEAQGGGAARAWRREAESFERRLVYLVWRTTNEI